MNAHERPGVLCLTCGEGHFQPANARGQAFLYRGAEVTLDEDLVLPTCDACGEQLLGHEDTLALDAALERAWQRGGRGEA